jgi:hypothetical protein
MSSAATISGTASPALERDEHAVPQIWDDD